MGDTQIDYHYYLSTGVDAGLPYVVHGDDVDTVARRMARRFSDKFMVYKQQRPPSCGQPIYEDEDQSGI